MKVYYHGKAPTHRIFVQPGVDHPETSEWMEPSEQEGKNKPKLFEVFFENFVATVPDNLGKYLIDKGLASRSKIIVHAEV